jgi:hypothetical protein
VAAGEDEDWECDGEEIEGNNEKDENDEDDDDTKLLIHIHKSGASVDFDKVLELRELARRALETGRTGWRRLRAIKLVEGKTFVSKSVWTESSSSNDIKASSWSRMAEIGEGRRSETA